MVLAAFDRACQINTFRPSEVSPPHVPVDYCKLNYYCSPLTTLRTISQPHVHTTPFLSLHPSHRTLSRIPFRLNPLRINGRPTTTLPSATHRGPHNPSKSTSKNHSSPARLSKYLSLPIQGRVYLVNPAPINHSRTASQSPSSPQYLSPLRYHARGRATERSPNRSSCLQHGCGVAQPLRARPTCCAGLGARIGVVLGFRGDDMSLCGAVR